jgi:hypothetical protein
MAIDFPGSPINGQIFTAPNGIVYQYSTTYGSWLTQVGPAPVLKGYRCGLCNWSAANTIVVAPGVWTDTTAAATITNTVNFTKTLGGAWTAGTGNAGLGTGVTLVASAWYYFFVAIISGSFDVFIDTDVNGSHKPAGTTAFRRVGGSFTAASVLTVFYQVGNYIYWNPGITTVTGTSPAQDSSSYGSGSPPIAGVQALVQVQAQNTSTTVQNNFLIGPPVSFAALFPGIASAQLATASANTLLYGTVPVAIPTNNSNIRIQFGALPDPSLTLTVRTIGYIDELGECGNP